jgi:hypothetical protein
MTYLTAEYVGEATTRLQAACACHDTDACTALIAKVKTDGHGWFADHLTDEAWDAGLRPDISAGQDGAP